MHKRGFSPELFDLEMIWVTVLDYFQSMMPDLFFGQEEMASRERLALLFEEAVSSYPNRGAKSLFVRNITSHIEEKFLENEIGSNEEPMEYTEFSAFSAEDMIESEYLC